MRLMHIIQDIVAPNQRSRRTRGQAIAIILQQLRKQQADLEDMLSKATTPARRRHLELQLAVNRLQQEKGRALQVDDPQNS